MDQDPQAAPPRVDSTLSKGLLILEALNAAQGSMGVSALSRALGLTKSNTYRLLQSLCALGYVRHEADKTYAATLKTWQVGRATVETLNLRPVAADMMRYLSEETGEAIYLAVRDGQSVVYIDKREIKCACVGGDSNDVLRAGLPPAFVAHTDKTITTLEALDADIKATRLRGYALDRGEYRPQIFSFGAVIALPDGAPAGALGVSVPNVNLKDGENERIGALGRHAAAAVSEALGRL